MIAEFVFLAMTSPKLQTYIYLCDIAILRYLKSNSGFSLYFVLLLYSLLVRQQNQNQGVILEHSLYLVHHQRLGIWPLATFLGQACMISFLDSFTFQACKISFLQAS